MPPRSLVVEFTKMSGAGNDFVVLDNRFYAFSGKELSDLAERWCARRTGVGADGLLALEASDEAHFRMRYFNADGSVGTMCGNGARCLARFAHDAGLAHTPLHFVTDAGPYSAEVSESSVRLAIPSERDFAELPEDADGPARCYAWTGTEHLVGVVDRVDQADVAGLGARLRRTNPPKGANVNFAEVTRSGLRVRTFEKGVEAETLACGTGATASAVAARRQARFEADRVSVEMPGGTLVIGFSADGKAIYLEGPADYVFRGTLEIPV